MIDYCDGLVIIATNKQIITVNIEERIKNKMEMNAENARKGVKKTSRYFSAETFSEDEITAYNVNDNAKIITLMEIGYDMTALVTEDLITHDISFLRMTF
jgi:hypothetical protein